MKYGQLPKVIGHFPIECDETMFFQYLPIKMARSFEVHIPDPLYRFSPLVKAVLWDMGLAKFQKHYVYLTAKHVYVMPQYWGNRPGWHSDGYMTDDLNYVWYDRNPTIFNNSDFNLSPDHALSLIEMEQQALPENDITFPNCTLLKLDQYNIHKVAPVTEPAMRTFVKISVSTEQYNLKGNSHNYLFDYKWEMHERSQVRNDPHKKQTDYAK